MDEAVNWDSRAFRTALGEFVTGVTIITTTDAAGQPHGLTANSFNSVSLDPPLVLFSLALDSQSLPAFRQAQWWAVHVLAADQEALSTQFAQRDTDKFAGVAVTAGPGGIPLLDGAAARFICRAAFEYEGGDHAIFLGEVREFDQAGRTPLIYHQGRYGGVLPAAAGGGDDDDAVEALVSLGLVDGAGSMTEQGVQALRGIAALAARRGALTAYERQALRALLGKLVG